MGNVKGGAAKKPAAKRRPAAGRRAVKPPARPSGEFTMREKRAMAAFLDMELTDPALVAMLSVQQSTGLSVYNGELFAIDDKVPSRDAAGVVGEKWVRRPAAGRDGFLAVAERSGVFGGIVGDVVCANDTFEVDWSNVNAVGGAPLVIHRHASMTGAATGVEAREHRGQIIGAWAKGYRSDRAQPFFYFAPLKQHGRTFAAPSGGELTWLGAWEYTNAMILKCAMSYVLRILFVITGVMPADELKNDPTLARQIDEGKAEVAQVARVLELPDAVPAGPVRDRLIAAVEAANGLQAGAWTAAKAEMVFGGRSDAELERLAAEIELGNLQRGKVAEREQVMPGPGYVDELRARLKLARTEAGAARTDGAYFKATERVAVLEAELQSLSPDDPPAS